MSMGYSMGGNQHGVCVTQVVMPPWRQADHNGRDERITHLSGDGMREAMHTPVCLPPDDGGRRRRRSPGGQARRVHVGTAALVCLDSSGRARNP
jgi:hypothetical protein